MLAYDLYDCCMIMDDQVCMILCVLIWLWMTLNYYVLIMHCFFEFLWFCISMYDHVWIWMGSYKVWSDLWGFCLILFECVRKCAITLWFQLVCVWFCFDCLCSDCMSLYDLLDIVSLCCCCAGFVLFAFHNCVVICTIMVWLCMCIWCCMIMYDYVQLCCDCMAL